MAYRKSGFLSGSMVSRIVLAGAAMTAVSGAARAAEKEIAFEEIVVTANKRVATSTQDIAGAVQAFDGNQLSRSGVSEFSDFAVKVPSLQFTDLGPGDKKYVIRGINSGGESTVGVYYDEAILTASNANDGGGRNADIRFFDLERIEVLKGPQGTLYGANSMAGTIRFITNKPKLDTVEGKVKGELSTTEHGGTNYTLNGMINLPIMQDKLAVRAVGWLVDNSGYVDAVRIPSGPIENVNNDKTKGARIALKLQATDNLSLLATATVQSTDSDGSARYTPEGVMSYGDAANGFDPVPGGNLVNTDLTQSPWNEDIKILGLTAEYTTDIGTFTATSNWFNRDIEFNFDSTPILFYFGVPITGITQQPQERDIWSGELRYASNFEGPVNFVVGGFAENEDLDFDVYVVKANEDGLPAGPFNPALSDDALTAGGNTFFGRYDNRTRDQKALFGEVTFDINDKLSAVFGMRYFTSDADSTAVTVHPFAGNIPPDSAAENAASFNKTTYKFNLSYQASDDLLLYATAAQGFRAGGVNQADLGFGNTFPRSYAPDTLWSYEVGEKAELLDGRLRLNVTAYLIDWKDMQILSGVPFRYISNAGPAQVKGLEVEMSALLSTSLKLDVGMSYQDAKLTGDEPQVFDEGGNVLNDTSRGHDGDRIPSIPKFQMNAGLAYSTQIADEADLTVRADASYRGSTQTEFNDDVHNADGVYYNVPLDNYLLVDLRATVDWRDYEISLFAKNLFDKQAQISAFYNPAQDPLSYITNRPRTIGISIARNF